MDSLREVDGLEVLAIIDNEVDVMSPVDHVDLKDAKGKSWHLGLNGPRIEDRGEAATEFRMDSICCGAHGLSLMITAIIGDERRTILFDTGPEENPWEHNVKRLKPDLSAIEIIQLSHWHRDHTGGLLRAIRLINHAKGGKADPVIVDVHPARPDARGLNMKGKPVSMEPDPSFEEIQQAGGSLRKEKDEHAILNGAFVVSGQIPGVTSYEKGLKNGIRFDRASNSWTQDEEMLDERFLMCKIKGKGVVVFTGCSHRGAINASKHALQLLNDQVPLHAVVGGYHLVDGHGTTKVEDTVTDFEKLKPNLLLAGHCTGWRAKFEIEKRLPGCLVPCTAGTTYIL